MIPTGISVQGAGRSGIDNLVGAVGQRVHASQSMLTRRQRPQMASTAVEVMVVVPAANRMSRNTRKISAYWLLIARRRVVTVISRLWVVAVRPPVPMVVMPVVTTRFPALMSPPLVRLASGAAVATIPVNKLDQRLLGRGATRLGGCAYHRGAEKRQS
jgi:hypothetical protein